MKTLLPKQAYPLILSLLMLIGLMVGLDYLSDEKAYESEALILHGIPSVPAIGGWSETFRAELKKSYSDLLEKEGREQALENLAYLYHANGFAEEAQHAYLALRLAHPFEARWPYLIGAVKSDYSDQTEVIKSFETALSLEPDSKLTRYRLARSYFKDGNFSEANEILDTTEASDDPWFPLLKGEIALKEERFEEAVEYLRQSMEIDPNIKDVYELIAEAYLNVGDSKSSREVLWRMNQVESESELVDPRLLQLREYCYDNYKLRRFARVSILNDEPLVALDLLKRALEIDPEDFEACLMLAEVARESGSFGLAIEFFKRARDIDSRDDQTYLGLAGVHVANSEYKEAIRELEQGLQVSFHRSELLIELGDILLRAGNTTEAEEAFRAVFEEDAGNPLALKRLGLLLFDKSRDEARELLETYLRSAPNDAEVVSILSDL